MHMADTLGGKKTKGQKEDVINKNEDSENTS